MRWAVICSMSVNRCVVKTDVTMVSETGDGGTVQKKKTAISSECTECYRYGGMSWLKSLVA